MSISASTSFKSGASASKMASPTFTFSRLSDSKDLPKSGIGGAGRPTLLEISQMNKIRATDQLFANQPIINHHIESFAEPFPIYPDGPVTLRLPIQTVNAEENPIQAQIAVTYMACSSKGRCLPPVIEKQVSIEIANNLILTE